LLTVLFDALPTPVAQGIVGAWVVLGVPVGLYVVVKQHVRPKPEGYVGRYRRPTGDVVHVIRTNGRLMVASEERPGIRPRDLGNVNGRELLRWDLLGRSPDGHEGVPSAQ
jgi:hypothetical protein